MQSCQLILLALIPVLAAGCTPTDEIVVPVNIDFETAARILDPRSNDPANETWHVHRIDEYKLGHRWTRTWELEDGNRQRLVVDRLEIPRFGAVSRQILRYGTLETPEGKVIHFAAQTQIDRQETRRVGVIDGATLHIKSTNRHRSSRSEFDWPSDARGFFAVEDALREPTPPGEVREVTLVSPLQEGLTIARIRNRDGNRIETLDNLGRVTGTYAMDSDGAVLWFKDAFLGVETRRADELEANHPNHIFEFDLAVLASVPFKVPGGNWKTAKHFECTVTHESLDPADLFANCSYQRMVSVGPRQAKITVQMPTFDSAQRTELDLPLPGDAQPNRWLESDDAAIEAFALAAVANEYEPIVVAQRLHETTFRAIKKSALGKQFASAKEALENRAGDCTEHAMLLAAALRNRNIPARVALGLVYSESSQSFVYHMWNEAWIDGRWIPFDAMAPESVPHAYRLRLSSTDMDVEELAIVAPVLRAARKLTIQ